MSSTTLFSKTPPVKLFFLASIPGMISMLASSLYQTFDGILVGQFLGATAFAALNLAMPFVVINFAISDMIGVGSAVPISVCLGKKQNQEANNIFTCSILMIIGGSIITGAIIFAAAPLFIGLMGAEGDFADFAIQYLRVYALCSPFTTIVYAMDNYLRISGYIRGSMGLNILMSILSVGFGLLFLGVFRWGIWASALGSCSSMFICALVALSPFIRGKAVLHFCKPQFSLKTVRQIFSCGCPSFLQNIATRITSIIMNAILVRLGGETAVSVYGVLMFVDGFIQPLLYGMCDSVQPAIGYNWGAQKYSRVRALGKCCFVASAVVSILCVFVIAFLPAQITRLFISDVGADVLALSISALHLFCLTYIIRWVSFATQSFMLAIEKSLPASIISVSTALIFPVILLAVLWPLGLTGIWLNLAGASLLSAVMSIIVLKKARPELYQPDAADE
ncbi:MAG TPA: MATE family efflux transporter [Candidatus Merdivicinus intestinigallinarum]|nr:MATE family efflux transporter [Candidatus Merdivicinus intestinigallinarum]